MNASPSSFSNAIPGWMGEAFGQPSATEAMQWLLATICQQVGAEACLVVRINGAGTHGSVSSFYGQSLQTLPRVPHPLGGSAFERALAATAPFALEATSLGSDTWLANRGITGGAMVPLQQGPVKFGSLGVCFMHDADISETLTLLAELRMLIWPLLCWQMLGTEMNSGDSHQAATASVHRANNILSNIVLLTDLALDSPCGRDDERLRSVLQRIAGESVRCADVLREIAPG